MDKHKPYQYQANFHHLARPRRHHRFQLQHVGFLPPQLLAIDWKPCGVRAFPRKIRCVVSREHDSRFSVQDFRSLAKSDTGLAYRGTSARSVTTKTRPHKSDLTSCKRTKSWRSYRHYFSACQAVHTPAAEVDDTPEQRQQQQLAEWTGWSGSRVCCILVSRADIAELLNEARVTLGGCFAAVKSGLTLSFCGQIHCSASRLPSPEQCACVGGMLLTRCRC